MHIYYLHGFASSPRSTKAAYLAEQLRPHGLVASLSRFQPARFLVADHDADARPAGGRHRDA